jgi:phosphate uptake regulator
MADCNCEWEMSRLKNDVRYLESAVEQLNRDLAREVEARVDAVHTLYAVVSDLAAAS